MNISKTLKELRKERGLTQAELAKMANLAPSCIAMIETGKREPNVITLCCLAKALNVSTDYLAGLEDDFGQRIESGTENDVNLTAEELQIITDYRTLSPGLKDMIKKTMDIYTNRTTIEAKAKSDEKK